MQCIPPGRDAVQRRNFMKKPLTPSNKNFKIFDWYQGCVLSEYPLTFHFWFFTNYVVGKSEFGPSLVKKLHFLQINSFMRTIRLGYFNLIRNE